MRAMAVLFGALIALFLLMLLIEEQFALKATRSLQQRPVTKLFSLVDAVRDAVTDRRDDGNFMPYLSVGSAGDCTLNIDDNIVLETDVIRMQGMQQYTDVADSFRTTLLPQLVDGRCTLTQLSAQGSDKVLIRWNVTFVPDSVVPLSIIGNVLPFVRVEYFDVLHLLKVRSTFSWERLLSFLRCILEKGEMRLPHAVIQGTTIMQFRPVVSETNTQMKQSATKSDSDTISLEPISSDSLLQQSAGSEFIRDRKTSTITESAVGKLSPNFAAVRQWQLVSQSESLNLVKSINSGVLQNRKLAFDVLQFLDSARPAFISVNDWNDLLIEKVSYNTVPGMKQFDIDGIDPAASQGSVILATARRLPFVLLAAFLFVSAVYSVLSFLNPTQSINVDSILDGYM